MPSNLRRRLGNEKEKANENEKEKEERRGSHGEVPREGRGSK